MSWAATYPYLFFSGLLLAIFCVVLAAGRGLRPLMLSGAIASALYSFASPIFVPAYWQPVRLGDPLVGVEDLAFSFANGGIVCFFALWGVRARVRLRCSWPGAAARYLLWTAFGGTVSYLCHLAGLPVMHCFLVAMLVTGLALLIAEQRYWRLALTGGLGFTALYTVVLGVTGALFPDCTDQWNQVGPCSFTLLGFPMEEYLWALGFGAVLPPLVASACRLQLDPPPGG